MQSPHKEVKKERSFLNLERERRVRKTQRYSQALAPDTIKSATTISFCKGTRSFKTGFPQVNSVAYTKPHVSLSIQHFKRLSTLSTGLHEASAKTAQISKLGNVQIWTK